MKTQHRFIRNHFFLLRHSSLGCAFLLFLLIMFTSSLLAQVVTGSSTSKKISIGKPQVVTTKTVRVMPDLVIKGEQFVDPNENNTINGNERVGIKFKVENLGAGPAKKVMVRTSLKGRQITGLSFPQTQLIGDIKPGEVKEIHIPLTASRDLDAGFAEIKIEIIEEEGFDAYPLEMKIQTKPYEPPMVVVADAVFSTELGGKVTLNYPIQLKALIQNIGKGDAESVSVVFGFTQPNCVVLGETDRFTIGKMKPGETRELDFIFTATRRYTNSSIPVQIDIGESGDRYSRDSTISVSLTQNLVAQNQVLINAISTPVVEVTKASLTSEVDKNIPSWPNKNSNKFALIIGNEEYAMFQQGIGSESNVAFARNDASVFKDYVIQTLGFDEANVYFLTDATAGAMGQKIDLISKMVTKVGNQAEVIFYYAGHGLPDETTHIPYLIPVDVTAASIDNAIRLSEIYNKLGETGAKKITIILDACFSGGGRASGLLTARAVKIKPAEENITGNMIVFTASTGEQSALPYTKEKHGIFTYYLLKKLQETAGNLTYGALADYLKKTVSIESLRVNQKEQDPVVQVSPDAQGQWENWKLR